MSRKWLACCLIVIFVIYLAACQSGETTTATTSPSGSPPEIPFVSPTSTQHLSSSPAVTVSPTRSITQTYAQRSQFAVDPFTENMCRLPCIGNITPGVTTFQGAGDYLSAFATYETTYFWGNSPFINHSYFFDSYGLPITLESDPPFEIYTLDDSDTIEYISLIRIDYSIDDVIRDYGLPDQIFFGLIDPINYYQNMEYNIFLLYRDQRFSYHFYGSIVPGTIDQYTICPDADEADLGFVSLVSWREGFADFDEIPYDYPVMVDGNFWAIQAISEYSVEEYANLILDGISGNDCVLINNPFRD